VSNGRRRTANSGMETPLAVAHDAANTHTHILEQTLLARANTKYSGVSLWWNYQIDIWKIKKNST